MTPLIPEDPSLAKRQRPSIEAFVKNSSEENLWDLAELPADAAQEAAAVTVQPRRSAPGIPLLPLGPGASPPADGSNAGPPVLPVAVTPRYQSSQSPNVARLGRVRFSRNSPVLPELDPGAPEEAAAGANQFEDTFDNLEDWDVPEPAPTPDPAGDPVPVAALAPTRPAAPAAPVAAAPAAADVLPTLQAEPAAAAGPTAKPLSLRPHLNLSKLEALSLLVLTLLLLAGGYWVYDHSLSRVLGQASQTQQVAFPVRGTHVTVSRVATYWREPLKGGSRVEAVRRGVVLIPVAEITLQGGPGAIRALFLNENGLAVGDPITRQIEGATTLTLPATDGFDDISMHAAYRTGQTKPWTLRIFEAASVGSQGKDFKKLLELPVSSDTH